MPSNIKIIPMHTHTRVKNAPCHGSEQQRPYENPRGWSGRPQAAQIGGGPDPKNLLHTHPRLHYPRVAGGWGRGGGVVLGPAGLNSQPCARAHVCLCTHMTLHTHVCVHMYVWVHTCSRQSSPHFSPAPSMPGKHPHALTDLHNAQLRVPHRIYKETNAKPTFFVPQTSFPTCLQICSYKPLA